MATLTSFFGGGGGTSLVTPNFEQIKNLTYLNNTVFSLPNSNRGVGAVVVPLTNDKFFLLEGNSTSDVYASLWSINSNGSCTNVASAVQLSGCDEVASAAANGIDTMMVTSYNQIRTVVWDGASTLSVSLRYTVSTSEVQPMCTVGCLYDGTLMGCVGYSNSSTYLRVETVTTEGDYIGKSIDARTTFNADYSGRAIITGAGLYWMGQYYSNTDYHYGGFICLDYANNTDLMDLAVKYSGQVSNIGDSPVYKPPIMFPLKGGGVCSYTIGASNRTAVFVHQNEEGQFLPASDAPRASSSIATIDDKNRVTQFLDSAATFSRQANGSYILFRNGSQGAAQVTIEERGGLPTYTSVFRGLRHVGPVGASGITHRVSSAAVGNYVVKVLPNTNDNEVYFNVWQMN